MNILNTINNFLSPDQSNDIDHIYDSDVVHNNSNDQFCQINLKFEPNFWNTNNITYNNCYTYAMNDHDLLRTKKQMPGEKCNLPIEPNNYTCDIIHDAILCDYPSQVFRNNCDNDCPCGYHKMFLAIDDDGEHKDFHFYRQDQKGGTWSHKPGSLKVRIHDDSNQIIHDPREANRGTKDAYTYDEECGCYCVLTK